MQPETSRRAVAVLAVACAVAVLAVACALAALAMAAALLHHPQAAASYTPPPFDPAAVTGTPAAPEGYGTVDAPAYTVALCGVPAVQEGAAQLWFTNPGQNTVWLKVRIYTPDGILLGESGLLKPGQYVQGGGAESRARRRHLHRAQGDGLRARHLPQRRSRDPEHRPRGLTPLLFRSLCRFPHTCRVLLTPPSDKAAAHPGRRPFRLFFPFLLGGNVVRWAQRFRRELFHEIQ